MTQTTDQERVEYLSWISANYADIYSAEEAQMMWDHGHLSALAWKEQAARRAQVVPQGWSLQDAAQDALDWLEDDDLNLTHNIRERLRFALAAAPQPPEALKRENPATKPEVAPAPKFNHAAKRKLELLQGNGATITGYAIEKDGRRGAIDCHGFVYWWNDAAPQPPEAAKESVEYCARLDMSYAMGMREGWNRCVQNDNAGYVKRREHLITEARKVLNDLPKGSVKDSLAVEAAPVQMPEPIGKHRGVNIYYEHQVRQLLAAHGIDAKMQNQD